MKKRKKKDKLYKVSWINCEGDGLWEEKENLLAVDVNHLFNTKLFRLITKGLTEIVVEDMDEDNYA